MKALITGLTGFTGKHLRKELEEHGYEVFGLSVQAPGSPQRVGLRDGERVHAMLATVRPDVIFHLAGISPVARSWENPKEVIEVNVEGTINLLEAVRKLNPDTRVLLAGSAQQYGDVRGDAGAIREETPVNPMTPYAVSKCAQEYFGKLYYRAYRMPVYMVRTFLLAGPGQNKGLVMPDFASGIAAVEAGMASELRVGNLDSQRDFIHVKDAVRAYRLIVEHGAAGEVYNVGSGELHSIWEALEKLLDLALCQVPVVQPESKKRPADIRGACCNHEKLTAATGWKPEISFDALVADELNDWRTRTHAATVEHIGN